MEHSRHYFLLLNVQLITVGVSYQVPIFIPKKTLQLPPEYGGKNVLSYYTLEDFWENRQDLASEELFS